MLLFYLFRANVRSLHQGIFMIFCRFEVWHTLTEFICGHPTRLTSYLFLILEAAGGTSKGSLGLRWSIWQKLPGNPEAASAHYSSRLLKVLSKHQMLSGGRIDFHSCCNFANSTTKMIQHFSYRERSLTSLMYWSCLNIRSRRSQWWWGQQCWLGDRLHEIGGGRGCGTVMKILSTKYI